MRAARSRSCAGLNTIERPAVWSRKMIRPMSDVEARALIEAGRIGHLGCVADGTPYVVPVCYLLSDDAIYVHSLGGRKIRALRQDPRACLQVEEIEDDYIWRSAIAFGRFEEITDDADRRWALRRLLARFPQLTPVES